MNLAADQFYDSNHNCKILRIKLFFMDTLNKFTFWKPYSFAQNENFVLFRSIFT